VVPAATDGSEDTRGRKRCGGEFETFVVDGPHMNRRVEVEYEPVWAGDRGHLEVADAWLA